MILSYGGKNCWAFKEWMEINFKINKNVPDEYGFKNIRVVPALCFEGGNASGKSCALRVLSFIVDFCLNSFFYDINSGVLYDTFFNNSDRSEFYITFLLDETDKREYTYESVFENGFIHSENLFYKEKGKKYYLIKRNKNLIIYNSISDKLSGIVLKDNSSFISTFLQYGIEEFAPFKRFFQNIHSNVSYSGTYEDPLNDNIAEYYYNHPQILDKVVEILKNYDTGIENVRIEKALDKNGKYVYFSVFTHNTNSENRQLAYFSQSTGTKLLYNRLMDIIITLEQGGVLIFDELDNHLHSAIVPLLLDSFLDRTKNVNEAQIIFTSHDSSIMDIMKKYRTYLFKKEEGESFCYRIDELPSRISSRNDRSLEQVYKSGMIGGMPNV